MAEKKAEEIVTEEVTTSEEKACKKNSKKVLIAVITCVAVAALCVGGFFVYRMFRNNDPVKVSSDAVRGLKDIFEDAKDNNPGLTKIVEGEDPYEINTDITLELPEDMGKYSANILAQVDSKKEAFRVDVDAKAGKQTLLALSTILEETNLYFSLPDTMSKYYKIDISEQLKELETNLSEIDAKSYEKAMKYDWTKLIDYLADSIDDTFSKGDFKKESDEITVNGKDKKVNKYTAKLTAKKAAKLAENFLEEVEDDKELIEVIAELSDMKTSEVKDAIKDAIKEIKDEDFDSDEYINYIVYVTKSGKVVGYGFEVEGTELTIAEDGNVTEITVSAQGVKATLDIEKKSDDHYVITASAMGVVATIDIKDEVKTVKKNEEYKETLTIDFELNYVGESVKASLEAVSTIKKIDSIDSVKDAIDVETMTSEEAQTFMTQLEKSSLYKLIESFSKVYENNYSTANLSL